MCVTWWPVLYKNVVYKCWDAKTEENSTAPIRGPKQNNAAPKIHEILILFIYQKKKIVTKTVLDFFVEEKWKDIYGCYKSLSPKTGL